MPHGLIVKVTKFQLSTPKHFITVVTNNFFWGGASCSSLPMSNKVINRHTQYVINRHTQCEKNHPLIPSKSQKVQIALEEEFEAFDTASNIQSRSYILTAFNNVGEIFIYKIL